MLDIKGLIQAWRGLVARSPVPHAFPRQSMPFTRIPYCPFWTAYIHTITIKM